MAECHVAIVEMRVRSPSRALRFIASEAELVRCQVSTLEKPGSSPGGRSVDTTRNLEYGGFAMYWLNLLNTEKGFNLNASPRNRTR